MNAPPAISVIIPIYRVEAYLMACVDSVLRQEYAAMEIILVDDGSPDGCPAICDRYAGQDARIHVLHQENRGLAEARNAGIRVARGDYLVFLDADDYWERNTALSEMAELVKRDRPDVVLFGFRRHNLQTGNDVPLALEAYRGPGQGTAQKLALLAQRKYTNSAWCKLTRRSFLLHEDLFFPKGLRSEDLAWSCKLLCKAGKISLYPHSLLVYQTGRAGSITSTFSVKHYQDILLQLREETLRLSQAGVEEQRVGHAFWAGELCWFLAYPPMLPQTEFDRAVADIKPFLPMLEEGGGRRVRIVRQMTRLLGLKNTMLLLNRFLRWKGVFGRA